MIRELPRVEISFSVKRLLVALMAFGLFTFILGLFAAPERVWPNFLIAVYYVLSLGLGAGFFIAVQYVSNAGWSAAIRRIPEAMTSTLAVAAIGAAVLIFGMHTLYQWTNEAAVAKDAVLQGKRAWLNEPFFIARLFGYFVIWIVLSRVIVKNSVRQDEDGDVVHTRRNVRNSAIFIVLGVLTASMASVDLVMSLEPHWQSTVFAFLNLSGMFLSGLAMITVFMVILRRMGYDHIFTTAHMRDMGSLLLAFSFFWVYMWVSQHMLIWYSNIPEETSYYIFRHFGGWGSLSFMNVMLNWLVPFLILLPRATKRNDKIMLQTAIIILIGHWLDLFIMVMPVTFGPTPTLGLWEIGPFVGVMAVFFWAVFRALGRQSILPIRDPYLVESLPQLEH